MRTLQEVQNEYNMLCAQLGSLDVQKTQLLAQLEVQRQPLLGKVAELQKEAEQIRLVEAELSKKAAEVTAPIDQVVEVDGKKYAVEGHLTKEQAVARVKEATNGQG
jgi:peptidoglycan hydrolase CwlO-like protein